MSTASYGLGSLTLNLEYSNMIILEPNEMYEMTW